MSEQQPVPPAIRFALTPRQRRLRVITGVILAFIAAMILVGWFHPFFHPHPHQPMTPLVRKAFKVQVLVIGFYWISCALLTTTLFILAALDVREVRRKASEARRDYWQTVATEARERQQQRKRRRTGNGNADS